MAKAKYCPEGKCNLCGKQDEGILITYFWFIRTFVCETCFSKLFRKFRKTR